MRVFSSLYPLVGAYVNLEYPLPGGNTVRFLQDDEMYLSAQLSPLFDDGSGICFGVIARENFLLICTYGENAANPELILYKRR